MGSGTDVARESAEVVLLGNDLLKFVETVQVARRCRRIIWCNFAGTLAVDSLGMGLAADNLAAHLPAERRLRRADPRTTVAPPLPRERNPVWWEKPARRESEARNEDTATRQRPREV
jgi:hypothetical protein